MVIQSLIFGWEKFKENAAQSALISLVFFCVIMIPSIMASFLGEDSIFFVFLINLIIAVLSLFMQIGLISIGLKVFNGEDFAMGDLFSNFEYLGAFIIGGIIFNFAVGIAWMLLIIPGIYVGLRLALWPFFVVDHNMSGMDAIKSAWDAGSGNLISILLMMMLLGFINILGMLFLGLGLLVTIPVSIYAATAFYKEIGGGGVSFSEDFTDPAVIAKYKEQSSSYTGDFQGDGGNPNIYDGSSMVPEYLREEEPTSQPKTAQKSQDNYGYAPGTFSKEQPKSPLESTIESIVKSGNNKYKMGNYFGAIQDFTKAIDLDKNDHKHYYSRGTARIKTKDYLGAIDDFTKATKLKPRFARAWFNLGVVKSKIGDPNAKNDIREALRLDPSLRKLLGK